MTRALLSTYYTALSFIIFKDIHFYLKAQLDQADFIQFAKPFSFLLSSPLLFITLPFVTLALSLMCTKFHGTWLRSLTSLFFLVSLSVQFSYGKINHSKHIWMISCILVCFICSEKALRNIKIY